MLFLLIYNFKTIHKWNLHCLLEFGKDTNNPAAIYLSKVNHANTDNCQLCTDFTYCSGVFIVDIGQANTGWKQQQRSKEVTPKKPKQAVS